MTQSLVWPRSPWLKFTIDMLVKCIANHVLTAVIIPVLSNNTNLNSFVRFFFWFINSLLLLHNKAQCIFQGFMLFNLFPTTFYLRSAETLEGWANSSPRIQSTRVSVSIVRGRSCCLNAVCWQLLRDGAGWHSSGSNAQSSLWSIPPLWCQGCKARGGSARSCSWALQKRWWKDL